MKQFAQALEEMFRDQKQKILIKIRNDKIPVAWFSSPRIPAERVKANVESILNQGIDVRYMLTDAEN